MLSDVFRYDPVTTICAICVVKVSVMTANLLMKCLTMFTCNNLVNLIHVLTGFFRLHNIDPDKLTCTDEIVLHNMQLVEAFLFAIDSINNDRTVLPNIKVWFNPLLLGI